MHANIKGALAQIDTSWRAFEHNGKPMTKQQVKEMLEYAVKQGYTSTAQLSDDEVEQFIKP